MPKELVSEMIGRVGTKNLYPGTSTVSMDSTRPDYAFWDKLRRGKQQTYHLGGLFVKPLVRTTTAWVIGRGVEAECDHEYTRQEIDKFLVAARKTIKKAIRESYALGDCYIVVNPDATLTLVSPDLVDVITDPLDYRTIWGYRITTRLDKATITDEYRLDKRVITVKVNGEPYVKDAKGEIIPLLYLGRVLQAGENVFEFRNLIGMLPVIPWHYDVGSNEIYGHPMVEPMLPLYAEYDDVLTKSLSGVKLMGTPIPKVEEVEDPKAARDAMATRSEEYTDADGVTHTIPVVDFDDLEMVFTKGKFGFAAPGPFTEDAWRMLKNLFLLQMEHSGMPEWTWGGAIASSMASVEAQFPAFELIIDDERMEVEDPITQLINVWRAYRSLIDVRLDTQADVRLKWPPLTDENDEVVLKKTDFAKKNNLITGETALSTLQLVEDPAAEYEAAQKEASEREDEFNQRVDKALAGVEDDDLDDAA